MGVVGAVVVVSFEPAPGVLLAAVWDGGRWCNVHVLERGKYGPTLERWDMHAKWSDVPQIECTPDALRQLVEWRLEDATAMAELVAWAASFLDGAETPVFAHRGTPEFSAN